MGNFCLKTSHGKCLKAMKDDDKKIYTIQKRVQQNYLQSDTKHGKNNTNYSVSAHTHSIQNLKALM